MSNVTWKRMRSSYLFPRVTATKSPNLDAFMRTEVPSSSKASDKELAKIQTFVLDSLALLTTLLERAESMTPAEVQEAATTAAQLVGNTSARLSWLRREKIITKVNKTLLPLVKEEEHFKCHP